MLNSLWSSLAFLGDFHPVAVHFPIALIPAVLLIILYGRRYHPHKPIVEGLLRFLLYFTFLCALLALALGGAYAVNNNYDLDAVLSHLIYAVVTTLLLGLACLLYQSPAFLARLRWLLAKLGNAFWLPTRLLVILTYRVLKWPVIIILFPVYLSFLLLRKLYRLLPASWPAAISSRLRRTRSRFAERIQSYPALGFFRSASLLLALIMVLLTGLEGANLSRGEGHLTRNMPPWLQAVFAGDAEDNPNEALDIAFYESEVKPLLRRHCIKCHGEEKQSGKLRLDTYEHVISSGVVAWQNPYQSELVRRLLVPRDSTAAMPPPRQGRQMPAQDISVLVAWINGEIDGNIAGGAVTARLSPQHEKIAEGLEWLPNERLPAVEAYGAAVYRLLEGESLLQVNIQSVADSDLDTVLSLLDSVRAYIVDLDVSGQAMTEERLARISGFSNLTRISLYSTDIDDNQVPHLLRLQRLAWLNLYGTGVTEASLPALTALPELRDVYIGQEVASLEEEEST